jgi:3-hydroxyisobutyrate dehydrogenase
MSETVGFIGLGNMGGPMAGRLAAAGHALVVHDAMSLDRAPKGARPGNGNAGVAQAAETVLLSLPDGAISDAVAAEMIAAKRQGARVRTLVDTSTIGPVAAKAIFAKCAAAGIEYVDAPVSGGTAGAAAGTLAVMVSCKLATFVRLKSMLEQIGKNCFHVGEEAGQGQAMKVLNNFLSGTAMVATSEAIAFGEAYGLAMGTMIDVLNASSGQNTATSDKFPRRIATGKFDAGFTTKLLAKDVRLYLENVHALGEKGRDRVGAPIVQFWQDMAKAMPDSDFTRVYPFVKEGKR